MTASLGSLIGSWTPEERQQIRSANGVGKSAREDPGNAAFLMLRAPNEDGKLRYLLQKRPDGTWGLPGGTLHAGEDPWDGAVRESTEEMGALPGRLIPRMTMITQPRDDLTAHTYVIDLPEMFTPDGSGSTPEETAGWGWFSRGDVEDLPLHPAFEKMWESINWKNLDALAKKYNPAEPRNSRGEWGSGGSASSPAVSAPAAPPQQEMIGYRLWKSDEGKAPAVTPEQAAAVGRVWYNYNATSTNAWLRSGTYEGKPPSDQFNSDEKTFENLINGSKPFDQPAMLYRATRLGTQLFGPPGTATGKTFSDKGFVSLSASEETVHSYGDTIIRVHAPVGTQAMHSDQTLWNAAGNGDRPMGTVQEFTMAPGSQFTVTSDQPYHSMFGGNRVLDVTIIPGSAAAAKVAVPDASVSVTDNGELPGGAARFAWQPGDVSFSRLVQKAYNPDEARGSHGEWEIAGDPNEHDSVGGSLKSRLGRCYELAGKFVMEHPGSQLVHGSIQGFGNPRIGHAWAITQAGDIWEPATNQVYAPKVFEAVFNPQVTITYSHEEAMSQMVQHGHYGPWDASKGRRVDLNGQIIQVADQDDDSYPAAGGGARQMPDDPNLSELAPGGSIPPSAGGEPPHWQPGQDLTAWSEDTVSAGRVASPNHAGIDTSTDDMADETHASQPEGGHDDQLGATGVPTQNASNLQGPGDEAWPQGGLGTTQPGTSMPGGGSRGVPPSTVKEYNPAEPRNSHGEWGSGGTVPAPPDNASDADQKLSSIVDHLPPPQNPALSPAPFNLQAHERLIDHPELDGGRARSIYNYVSPDGNHKINGGLRAATSSKIPDGIQRDVANLDSNIRQETLKSSATVYRGTSASTQLLSQLKPGSTFTDKAYVSTSTDAEWAKNFAIYRTYGSVPSIPFPSGKALGGIPIIMKITAPAGSHMMMGESDIKEYVFPRNTSFHVDSVSNNGYLYNITATTSTPTQAETDVNPKT